MAEAVQNAALFNGFGFNEGGEGAAVSTTAHDLVEYRLDVRESDGTVKALLRDWFGGRWTERYNAPDTLELSCAADGPGAEYLCRPYEVWLHDRFGNCRQKFRIVRSTSVLGGDGSRYVEVSGESLLGQLNDEVLIDYRKEIADGYTRATILADWLLNHQTASEPILFGAVDAAISSGVLAVDFEAGTLLEAIVGLQGTYNGDTCLWVNPRSRRLYWSANKGNRFRQLRYRKNVRGLQRSEEDGDFFTRLWIYGAGKGAERVSLIDAGNPTDYLDADTQATYGVINRIVVESQVTDAAALLAVGQRYLEVGKVPPVSYEVDALDLAQNRSIDFAHEAFETGSLVQVVDEAFAPTPVNVEVRVLEIQHNLDEPMDVRVTLNNRRAGLEEILADLVESVTELETEDIFDPADPAPEPITGGGPPSAASGDSPYAAHADHVHDASDLISTDDPEPVGGTAAAGTSTTVSASDHVHELDPAALEWATATPATVGATGAVGTSKKIPYEDHKHALDATALPWGSSTPLGVGAIGSAGTAAYIARSDHAHAIPSAATFAGLASLSATEGTIARTADKHNFYVLRGAGAWQILHPFVQATAPSSQGERDGDLWYDTALNQLFVRRSSAWKAILPWVGYASGVGEANADFAYDGTNHRLAMRINGAWSTIPWVSSGKLYYFDGSSSHLISHYKT